MKKPVATDQRAPRAITEVVSRSIAGEVVLVPLDSGIANCDRVFILNETGAFLWERLDGRADRDALIQSLESEFDADRAALAADVDSFLSALDQRSLITWEPV